jgi:hypothetical protein
MAHVVKTDSTASAWLGPPNTLVKRIKMAVAASQPTAHHQFESGWSNQVLKLRIRLVSVRGRGVLISETEASICAFEGPFLGVADRFSTHVARRIDQPTTWRGRARSAGSKGRLTTLRAGVSGT